MATRGRRGCLLSLVIAFVIAVVGFVAADRVAANIAQERLAVLVANEVRNAGANSGRTAVTVDGFPFLTQVIRGRYSGGTVTLEDVSTEDDLTLEKVTVDVSKLRIPTDVVLGAEPHDVTAGRLDATVDITLAEIVSRLGVRDLQANGDNGKVRFNAPSPVSMIPGRIEGLGTLRLDGNRVWLDVEQLSAGGVPLPPSLVEQASQRFMAGYQLPPLPLGLKVTAIAVVDDLVSARAAASDVSL